MFQYLSLNARLLISFTLMILLLLLVSLFAGHQMKKLSNLTTALYAHPFTVSNHVRNAETLVIKIHRHMKDVVLAREIQAIEEIATLVDKIEVEALKSLQIAGAQYLGDKQSVQSLIDLLRAWRPIREEVFQLIRDGQYEAAGAITRGKGARHVELLEKEMNNLKTFAFNKAEQFLENAREHARSTFFWTTLLVIAAVAVMILAATSTTRSIIRPIRSLSDCIVRVTEGDLTVPVPVIGRDDELGQLTRATQEMLKSLRTQIRETIDTVKITAAASADISATISQMAATSSQTAASVAETIATAEEVRQTSQVANERAQFVSNSAQKTMVVTRSGQEAVSKTTEGMANIRLQMDAIADSIVRLSEQSQTIGKIIATVEDLADQSNLLAVNAAIEANKAGDHGKGFAVVAQEIRNLAEQSKQATEKINDILNDIVKATSSTVMATEQGTKAVTTGMSLATQSGEAIQSLAENMDNAADAAMQIAASIGEQHAGIGQVLMAMESINHASAQNVEGTNQLETSAIRLQELGDRLKNNVEQYKV